MKYIGRRIFFELISGNVIVDTGEKIGNVVPNTPEQDISNYTALSERNRETFDYIELEYGDYSQDFAECNGYRVNPETKEIEFSYSETDEETPPVQPTMEEQILFETKYQTLILETMQLGGMNE